MWCNVKNKVKIISILFLILLTLSSIIYADTDPYPDSDKPASDPFKSQMIYRPFELSKGVTGATRATELAGKIVGALQTVGVAVSVVSCMVLGFKYMMGSASDKAEYKKTMIPYLIGVFLIFSITTILNIVYNFAIKL